jgi:hypothetical protein
MKSSAQLIDAACGVTDAAVYMLANRFERIIGGFLSMSMKWKRLTWPEWRNRNRAFACGGVLQ